MKAEAIIKESEKIAKSLHFYLKHEAEKNLNHSQEDVKELLQHQISKLQKQINQL